ncbi:DUF485 domain-containing protein [Salininema proteolyticum]|uniref:DUF485 domain-containing protein n=1 Tax=Salininema proteolyticum TaxID=1607685 RepID=A0ABV8TTU0_9ACTN
MSTVLNDESEPTEGSAPPDGVHSSAQFRALQRTLFRFTVPATLGFMAWYFLYVFLSAYARDFMGTVLFGNINVALLLGLGQFVSTFAIAWAYMRYCSRKYDPAAAEVRAAAEAENAVSGKEGGR